MPGFGVRVYRDISSTMEKNQVQKTMENNMEIGIMRGFIGFRISQNLRTIWGYHFRVPTTRTTAFRGLFPYS